MKEYIVGAALILLFAFCFVSTFTFISFLEQDSIFDDCLEDCANTGALYYDYSAFARGDKIFLDSESVPLIDAVLSKRYNITGEDYLPDGFERIVTFYDDSMIKRVYENGVLISSTPFSYGLTDTDAKGVDRVINSPTIIVYVNAGKPNFRFNVFDSSLVALRSSVSYVYQEDF